MTKTEAARTLREWKGLSIVPDADVALAAALELAIRALEPGKRKPAAAKPSPMVARFLKVGCPVGLSLRSRNAGITDTYRELWPHLDGAVPVPGDDFPAEALAQFSYRMKYTGPGYGVRDLKPEAIVAAARYAGAAMLEEVAA